MHLEIASRAAALADAAGSPPDFLAEPQPVPRSPVLAVKALPSPPLAIRQRSPFCQTATPVPDAKPHRKHVHAVHIDASSPILKRSGKARRLPEKGDRVLLVA